MTAALPFIFNFLLVAYFTHLAYRHGRLAGEKDFSAKLDEYAAFSDKLNKETAGKIKEDFEGILHDATASAFVEGFRQGFANGQEMPNVPIEIALRNLDEAVRLQTDCARRGLLLIEDKGGIC